MRSALVVTQLALTLVLLVVAGLFQLADGVQSVAAGSLRGLKDTRVPMLITILAYWGVVAEEDLLGAGYNLEGARAALLRATYATRIGNLYRRSRGAGALPPGQIAMVCNDPGAICDQGIPG